jgi:histidinol dehydrogenase
MMRTVKYPGKNRWKDLTERPDNNQDTVEETVRNILSNVKRNGDEALINYTEKFDGVLLDQLSVSNEELNKGKQKVDEDLKAAIQLAKQNIRTFHQAQLTEGPKVETAPGVTCWRKSVPIEKVGVYIPGGSAPLFSTVLMLGIPAKLAGCKQIILCSPPQKSGEIHPYILYTADLLGIDQTYKAGGAQAIGAMAYGTYTIPKVDKIFGPGNSYVTKAKELVQQEGTAIDMPAGPSEQLVIADESCNPAFMAADLLSQAEHGPDSQVVLLSNSEAVIRQINREIEAQIKKLPRKEIAKQALQNSFAAVFHSLTECADFSNLYAPEHLIITVKKKEEIIPEITNAGSVFIGNYSTESAGDYASGTNHTLPTGGYAKSYSGLSVDSFMKTVTFQEITAEGIQNIGPAIEQMAAAEGLEAHKNAVTLRLKELEND